MRVQNCLYEHETQFNVNWDGAGCGCTVPPCCRQRIANILPSKISTVAVGLPVFYLIRPWGLPSRVPCMRLAPPQYGRRQIFSQGAKTSRPDCCLQLAIGCELLDRYLHVQKRSRDGECWRIFDLGFWWRTKKQNVSIISMQHVTSSVSSRIVDQDRTLMVGATEVDEIQLQRRAVTVIYFCMKTIPGGRTKGNLRFFADACI